MVRNVPGRYTVRTPNERISLRGTQVTTVRGDARLRNTQSMNIVHRQRDLCCSNNVSAA